MESSTIANAAGRGSLVPRLSYNSNNTTRVGRDDYAGAPHNEPSHYLSSLSSIHGGGGRAALGGEATGDRARSGDSYPSAAWLSRNNGSTLSGLGEGGSTSLGSVNQGGSRNYTSLDGSGPDRVGHTSRGEHSSSPAPRLNDRTAVGYGNGDASAGSDWRARAGLPSGLAGARDANADWRRTLRQPPRAFDGGNDQDEEATRRMTIPRWRSTSNSERAPQFGGTGRDWRREGGTSNATASLYHSSHRGGGDPNVYSGAAASATQTNDMRGNRWTTTHVGPNRTYTDPNGRHPVNPDGWRFRDELRDGMVNTPGRYESRYAKEAPMFRSSSGGREAVSASSATTETSSDDEEDYTSSSSSDGDYRDRSDDSGSSSSSPLSSSSSDGRKRREKASGNRKPKAFTDLRNFHPSGGSAFGLGRGARGGNGDDDRATVASMSTNDIDLDATPVVPDELLRRAQQPTFQWNRHPSHAIVLLLLQHRGIYLPRYRELIDYHMAELFLHYLDVCREGSYFVYYAADKWPKERFFRIRMLPLHRMATKSEPIPQLVISMHQGAVAIVDAIPLDYLVGVTTTPRAPCFRPFLESPNTILGCREGRGHRARLPVDGCFSLWFYDRDSRAARSIDLLTCDAKVYDIWTKTFMGLVSVNSSSVVQIGIDPGVNVGHGLNMADAASMDMTASAGSVAGVGARARGGGESGSGRPSGNTPATAGSLRDDGSASEARMVELTRVAQEQLEAEMAARQDAKKKDKKKR